MGDRAQHVAAEVGSLQAIRGPAPHDYLPAGKSRSDHAPNCASVSSVWPWSAFAGTYPE
jgi:hypothetical protein